MEQILKLIKEHQSISARRLAEMVEIEFTDMLTFLNELKNENKIVCRAGVWQLADNEEEGTEDMTTKSLLGSILEDLKSTPYMVADEIARIYSTTSTAVHVALNDALKDGRVTRNAVRGRYQYSLARGVTVASTPAKLDTQKSRSIANTAIQFTPPRPPQQPELVKVKEAKTVVKSAETPQSLSNSETVCITVPTLKNVEQNIKAAKAEIASLEEKISQMNRTKHFLSLAQEIGFLPD